MSDKLSRRDLLTGTAAALAATAIHNRLREQDGWTI